MEQGKKYKIGNIEFVDYIPEKRKSKDTGDFIRDCILFSGSRSSKIIGALTWITIGLMFALLGYIFAAVQCSQLDKI